MIIIRRRIYSKIIVWPLLQGCHEFSSELYQSLRTRVASEHFYFWLNALMEFSQAEHCLTSLADGDYSGAISAITDALKSYQKGFTSLTVSLVQFTETPRGRALNPTVQISRLVSQTRTVIQFRPQSFSSVSFCTPRKHSLLKSPLYRSYNWLFIISHWWLVYTQAIQINRLITVIT